MIIFITFFVGLLYWVFKADKHYIHKMKNMPLDNPAKSNQL
jgi:hypothetical protein